MVPWRSDPHFIVKNDAVKFLVLSDFLFSSTHVINIVGEGSYIDAIDLRLQPSSDLACIY